MIKKTVESSKKLSFLEFKNEVLQDYKIAVISRECSLLGRREVLTGKAKFGIFGGGKEVPQLAMAKAFKKGDWRSGYYRDQTFMMAIGEYNPRHFFSSLYAHPDIEADSFSAGRQMNGHFATHSIDEDGSWKNLKDQYNVSSDISPTSGQMPRLLGLAEASKKFRKIEGLDNENILSDHGNEIAWGTIGNASTSEGPFFETVNAAGVLKVPMVISIWDDEYGISVHSKYQTTKESISEILKGFQRDGDGDGYEIFVVNGWNYTQLVDIYTKAAKIAREEHIPVMIHVKELTQPQGHSTSGSHERYKSKERLTWEKEHDCIAKMREWILNFELEDQDGEVLKFVENEQELKDLEKEAKNEVRKAKTDSWKAFLEPMLKERKELLALLEKAAKKSENEIFLEKLKRELEAIDEPIRKNILTIGRKSLIYLRNEEFKEKELLQNWLKDYMELQQPKYSTHLYSELDSKATNIAEVEAEYDDEAEDVDARLILRDNFDFLLGKHKKIMIFGEDSGKIGDVNQGLEGLQEKHGEERVYDTGIRETTIIGQGIGMAMRGLRPIAEIQYLDYIFYATHVLTDDLATLRYRTFGKQVAPLIIRTRGHRLEGIWHSGSQMGSLINLVRGVYLLVPRNMTKAAGFYNTLIQSDEPAIVVENLNGYRLKERMPVNLGSFTTPIGVVETVKEGNDITLVSYGSTLRLVEEASKDLSQVGIDAEIIDAQSLLPFDIENEVLESVRKTNRLVVIDEDIPGGASAYLLEEIVNKQGAYNYLDSKPTTITAQAHRPAYGTDGDYFSKPSVNDIFEGVYKVMQESDPAKFKSLYF
ncbi:alpha-ketoacid dehydrogenase subunit alpha/beta [Lutimonas zeaxanthinifaciens]|uniref:alpha-ketoacid dehydrogenase subunit alpha/beta n=1 Tax=Lutimonas zeaxanthinifaciens TaxID=3060215 RepID=UPI00265CE5B5|nr:thiamine pyrophosphate-dependent enzyme [Lutimonas sp. YSD2104]WKK65074.1 thiamine pyrophosphate-dependent enzyme [Lutimonas sp. YSD2104]